MVLEEVERNAVQLRAALEEAETLLAIKDQQTAAEQLARDRTHELEADTLRGEHKALREALDKVTPAKSG